MGISTNQIPGSSENDLKGLGGHPGFLPNRPHLNPVQNEEVGLLDILRFLYRRKLIVLIALILTTSLSLGIYFSTPKYYKTKVSFMAISTGSGSGSLMAMASQLGSSPLMGGALGAAASKMGGGKHKQIINILQSQTLTEKIIQRFDLMPVIFWKQWDPVKKTYNTAQPPHIQSAALIFQKKIAKIKYEKKSSLINIVIKLADPVLAFRVANGMIVELQDFINNHSLTVEKRNRVFIEKQLMENRKKYFELGKELDQFFDKNKISSANPNLTVDLGSYDKLPETFNEFRKEIEFIQIDKAESKNNQENVTVSNVPSQVLLEYLTFKKRLIAQNHILLSRQYEMSKIEEAREDLAFQIIDKAQVRAKPSGPKLLLHIVIGIMGGLFLGIGIAYLLDLLKQARAQPAH